MKRATIVLTLLAGVATATPVHAAPGCTGLVTNLPATLSTPGVWCLGEDLGTMVASGYAVRIAASNVTLDCQGFRISGLAAGDATQTVGVLVADKSNAVIRGCNVRGFHTGIGITGGLGGHVVEDNRLDGNTWLGISTSFADTVTMRRNQVVDTGGNLPFNELPFGSANAIAISGAHAFVLEQNSIGNVFATEHCDCSVVGVTVTDSTGDILDNQISNLLPDGSGTARGIQLYQNSPPAATRVVVRDNAIINRATTPGAALTSGGPTVAICKDNTSLGFEAGFDCTDAGGNSSH